ncbi:sodium-coupled monocarboxylate transporter 1-like [Periplaneta americana]|uniref:sodium-coupled monocarboxylate transporter 1-like n=1 Tax=Periplaneta americana TaxID=6978 RepID=UPI0037E6FFE0
MSETFGWLDFTVFGLMLASSSIIGMYFGFWGKRDNSTTEYLHGGKTMDMMPVAVSLVSSMISGITIMGVPSEVYAYGSMYFLVVISAVIVGVINNYCYLPVFYGLQLTSTYEYLELRFNKSVRIMASVLSTIFVLLTLPIVVYVPALSFSQVSGLSMYLVTPVITVICIIYTMLGGLKAVVWTDVLQGVLMLVSSFAVIILGLNHVGGFAKVWDISGKGGRLRLFDMNPSPFARMTFWGTTIGNTLGWMWMIVNQAMVQKYLSLPTYSKARNSLIIFYCGYALIICMCCLTGLLIYTTYHDCDPIKTKAISRPDQILTYYVMDVTRSFPGLAGLFVAGILSAALSTLSSNLNSLGATIFVDFVQPFTKGKLSDQMSSNIIKAIVIGVGAVCIVLVFLVDKIGGILQGALAGSVCSLVFMTWLVFGTQKAVADGIIKHPVLPTTAKGCGFNDTVQENAQVESTDQEAFVLFYVSFMYYPVLGIAIVLVVATVVSLVTEPPNLHEMEPELFTPFVRRFLPRKEQSVEQEMLCRSTQQ